MANRTTAPSGSLATIGRTPGNRLVSGGGGEKKRRVKVVLGSSGEFFQSSARAWSVPCEQLPNRRPSPGVAGPFCRLEAN